MCVNLEETLEKLGMASDGLKKRKRTAASSRNHHIENLPDVGRIFSFGSYVLCSAAQFATSIKTFD